MERCGTCRRWLQYMKTEGHNCVSSERAERLSFDSCPPADFGCPFHEPRPAPLTCGGCGWREEGPGFRRSSEGIAIRYSGCDAPLPGRAAVTVDRPACQHYKAKGEYVTQSEQFLAGARVILDEFAASIGKIAAGYEKLVEEWPE